MGSNFENEHLQVTNNGLISLVTAFIQTHFGNSSLSSTIKSLANYRSNLIKPTKSTQWIDSGGYSIIVGDVPFEKIRKTIDFYDTYLKREFNNYDKIFSLDIPIGIKYPQLRNYNNIKYLNKLSLSKTRDAIISNPKIKDKLYFIYHFKIKEQHEIWSQLYKELNLKDYIIHRAIGGLVGVKGSNFCPWINFTTFLPMTFKLLYDYIESGHIVPIFKIHILGVYGRAERFCIAVLEKLFNKLLKEYDSKVEFTYDSINYIRTSQLKFKTLPVFNFNGSTITKYNNASFVPDDILKKIYYDELTTIKAQYPKVTAVRRTSVTLNVNKFEYIKSEIFRCLYNKFRLRDASAFGALNIYSNTQLDNLFEYVVDKYNVLDAVRLNPNTSLQTKAISDFTTSLKTDNRKGYYGSVFTSHLINFIERDLLLMSKMHDWWVNDRSEDKLEQFIQDRIKQINFSVKDKRGVRTKVKFT